MMNFEELIKKSWQKYTPALFNLVTFTLIGILLCFTIILIPTVVGGFTRGFINYVRDGKELEYSELWNFDKYFEILLLAFVGGTLMMIGYILLFIPGLILNVFWFYAIFYIIDKDLGFWEALMASQAAVKKTGFFNHLIIVFITSILISIGSSVLFGTIFTAPLALLIATCVYLDIAKKEKE